MLGSLTGFRISMSLILINKEASPELEGTSSFPKRAPPSAVEKSTRKICASSISIAFDHENPPAYYERRKNVRIRMRIRGKFFSFGQNERSKFTANRTRKVGIYTRR